MEFVASELRSCDRLGIVCYSSEATVQLPMRTMDDAGKAAALAAIRQIHSGGSTNFSGGVLAALAELQSSRDEQRSTCPAAVIVLTDGHPTAGISNPTQLKHSLGSAHAELGFSAPMFTFGFGEDHNSMLLTELAEGAEGMYSHVEDAEMIASSFAECLGGITSLVAQAVQLKITPGDGVSIDRVFSPHKQKGGEEGAATERTRTIMIGDLLSEGSKDILIDCDLPKATGAGSNPLLQLEISYFDITTSRTMRHATNVAVGRHPSKLGAANVEVEVQRQRILVAEAMKSAQATAAHGDMCAPHPLISGPPLSVLRRYLSDI